MIDAVEAAVSVDPGCPAGPEIKRPSILPMPRAWLKR